MTAERRNFAQPSIPKFDGDYDHWSMLMENLLRSKEYWSLIETGYSEPVSGETMTTAQRKILEELKLKLLVHNQNTWPSREYDIITRSPETILGKIASASPSRTSKE
ncbi:hypothetical protein ACLB2K_041469 [Fragaria x ananassa]